MNQEYILINNSVSVSSDVPKQFKILPLGLVKSEKGDFMVDNESFASMKQDFSNRQLQIPIDYEHQTLKDVEAPAAGWIKGIVLKQDGIYVDVDWTEKAADYLHKREYKYCSPVVSARTHDRKALKLHSVALTNKPAISEMTPIVNSDKPEENSDDSNSEKAPASMAALAALLSLPDGATLDDIYKAVSALLTDQTAMKLKVESAQFEAYKREVGDTVELALREGKITPYQREWAYQNAMTDLNEFTIWLKGAIPVVPMGKLTPQQAIAARDVNRSDKLLGLTRDDTRKYNAASL